MKQNTIKPTFTPGPWKCYPVNPMQCNNNRTFEIHGFETEKSVRDVLPTEVESNAKLIAAAPELLVMLSDARATLLRWNDICPEMWDERDQDTLDNIELAIKKATE